MEKVYQQVMVPYMCEAPCLSNQLQGLTILSALQELPPQQSPSPVAVDPKVTASWKAYDWSGSRACAQSRIPIFVYNMKRRRKRWNFQNVKWKKSFVMLPLNKFIPILFLCKISDREKSYSWLRWRWQKNSWNKRLT